MDKIIDCDVLKSPSNVNSFLCRSCAIAILLDSVLLASLKFSCQKAQRCWCELEVNTVGDTKQSGHYVQTGFDDSIVQVESLLLL